MTAGLAYHSDLRLTGRPALFSERSTIYLPAPRSFFTGRRLTQNGGGSPYPSRASGSCSDLRPSVTRQLDVDVAQTIRDLTLADFKPNSAEACQAATELAKSDFKPVVSPDHQGRIPSVVFVEQHTLGIAAREYAGQYVVAVRMWVVSTMRHVPDRVSGGMSDRRRGSGGASDAMGGGEGAWQVDKRLYRYDTALGRTIDWRALRKDFERQDMEREDKRLSHAGQA